MTLCMMGTYPASASIAILLSATNILIECIHTEVILGARDES